MSNDAACSTHQCEQANVSFRSRNAPAVMPMLVLRRPPGCALLRSTSQSGSPKRAGHSRGCTPLMLSAELRTDIESLSRQSRAHSTWCSAVGQAIPAHGAAEHRIPPATLINADSGDKEEAMDTGMQEIQRPERRAGNRMLSGSILSETHQRSRSAHGRRWKRISAACRGAPVCLSSIATTSLEDHRLH